MWKVLFVFLNWSFYKIFINLLQYFYLFFNIWGYLLLLLYLSLLLKICFILGRKTPESTAKAWSPLWWFSCWASSRLLYFWFCFASFYLFYFILCFSNICYLSLFFYFLWDFIVGCLQSSCRIQTLLYIYFFSIYFSLICSTFESVYNSDHIIIVSGSCCLIMLYCNYNSLTVACKTWMLNIHHLELWADQPTYLGNYSNRMSFQFFCVLYDCLNI